MYPNIAIQYKLHPKHLGIEYIEVYTDIVNKRLKAKKLSKTLPEGEDRRKAYTTQAALKLSANGTYGMYANKYSWLYDIQVTFQTTINGQLLLSMLIERLSEVGWVFTANTDGVSILIKKDKIEQYYKICKEWERISKLTLEYEEYKKMIMMNVNNYLWIKEGDVKKKGLFVTEPVLGNSNDFMVIPKALEAYFVKGIPIKEFITSHDNIYDFCASYKISKKFTVYFMNEIQQNLNRFYVSKKGAYLYKQKDGGNMQNILKGYSVQLFNKYEEKSMKKYHINYDFYISKCNEIINQLEPKQTTLF